tara:strand:- start:616 stop:2289 length:1674 start_codon:yes stop_codon:yes gene_type:complete
MRNISNKLPYVYLIIFSFFIILDRYNLSELINYNYHTWHTSYGASINQHLSGWYGYVNDKWSFPLTITNSINYPKSSSIILTDSLPIFAIFFKIFKTFLPENFHYFGIWKIICILFLCIFSYNLSNKHLTNNNYLSLLFSIFCICSFPLFSREGNPTLNGHFLLILGFHLYFNLINEFNVSNFTKSFILLIISLHIHFYFFSLIFLFILSAFLQNYLDKKMTFKFFVKKVILMVFLIISVGYITGFFYSFGGIGFDRFDNKGMPLLSLFFGSNEFNFQTIFNNQTNVMHHSEQYESLNYLGIGLILLIPISLYLYFLNNKYFNKHIVLLTTFTLVFIYSLGSKIYITENLVFQYNHHKIPFMSFITGLLAVAGRLFIFNYIIIIFFCFKQIISSNLNNRLIFMILTFVTIIQFYEIYLLNYSENKIKSNLDSILKNELFLEKNEYEFLITKDDLINKIDIKDTVIIPPYVCEGSILSQKIYGYLLYNKKKVNSIWQGRDNFNCEEKKDQANKMLSSENFRKFNYIFLNKNNDNYPSLTNIKNTLNCKIFEEITICKK